MKRHIKKGLVGLLILLILLGSLMVHTIMKTQSYGRLINYVGIVRGATQRLVKLELDGQPNDELIFYLDGILVELTTGEGQYDLLLPKDMDYVQKLTGLYTMWDQLKKEIYDYREEGSNRQDLIALSETYFAQANDTVFAAEDYSYSKVRRLLLLCGGTLAVMGATWLLIFWAASRKMINLETTNEVLSDLNKRDPLTGVYRFEAFKEEAQRLLDTASGAKYAVVYTDFVDFKYINDVYSYTFGDGILAEYGKILTTGLKEGELCGRVSADNFVLLLKYADRTEIAARRRRDDQKLAEFLSGTRYQNSLATYCGICCVEDVIEELKIEGFLDRANFARKVVKNGSSPNYVYYDESIRNRLWKEKEVESRMLAALEKQEFQVYYQPKVDAKTGRAACAEALVRWCSEGGSVIPPDLFIPVFERKLMIDRLDQYVFDKVCCFLRQMLDKGIEVQPVSVNVSRLQFYDQEFVTRYTEIRDFYRIPKDLLEIEFTESIVFDNTNRMMQIVEALKGAGFSCSIDDFGKGYSSLGMLKNLPVDVLKIDQIFFQEGEDRERDLAVVQGIIEIGQKLHIKTVAEGIETREQAAWLRENGCDLIQGYAFYRPMPQKDYGQLLESLPRDIGCEQ